MSGASENARRSPDTKFIRVCGNNVKCYQEMDVKDVAEFLQPGTKFYAKSELKIIISPPCHSSGWHMSISTEYRNPTWEEIRDAWYHLVPDADKRNGAMFFPPKDEYVNVHTYCFHIHEVPLDLKNMWQTNSV